MNEQKFPCVLQDFVPFGAAALLPLTPILDHESRAMGISDHILHLGDWFRSKISLLRPKINPLQPKISPLIPIINPFRPLWLLWPLWSPNPLRPETCPMRPQTYPFQPNGRNEIHPCVLQNISPLRLLPYSYYTSSANYSKQGIGYH